ncbi:MAG: DUF456 domain-containing protein [Nitriliruptoraceae bacterium]
MEVAIVTVALLLMLIGLFGVLVPVLPGLVVIWLVGVGSLLWLEADATGWWVAAWLTVLFAAGTLATIWLPTRRGRAAGASTRSLAIAAVGALLGFFLLPVAGFLLGGLAGLYLGEWWRLGDHAAARSSALSVLRAYGVGVVIELVLAVVMIVSWATAVFVRGW